MLGILSLLMVVTSTVPLLALMGRSAAAAPGDDPWVAPNDLTSTRATSSINWLSRLSFRSPLSIVDSAGDVEYRTTSDIFDNGSTNFLRDGDGSNAWYLYVPVGQDKKPLENPANKCFGGFLVELDEGGEDMWLHALQPKRSTDGTACIYGRRSAVQGRVSDGIGDEERQFMFDIGSGGQEIDGKSDRWRFFVAGFFWAHKDSINAFDSSKKPFVPLTGAELDTARSDWQSTQAPNAPPEAARKASGWRFFKSGDCKEEILVVTPSNKDVYIFHYPDDSLVSKSDDGFAGCAYGREMNGDSTDHIEAVSIPASVAVSENATKAEGEVDPTEFEGSGNSVTSGTEEETELPETCATKLADNSALAWVLCPIINMAESLIGKIDEMLSRFLFVDLGRFNTNSGLFVAWNNIRQISTVILVIIALIMIFSEAMGEGFLSNYSVKKILPRLVLAVIGIQFSWVLTREFINISNILGNGIQGLMLAPFAGIKEGLGAILPVGDLSGAAQAGYFVAIFAAIPVAFGALATVAIGVFIALVIAFVTLILRYMVIVIGVMFAPIGIAMSVLPGTQKVSKLWWESLEKAVIMYPIIMAMLAAGKIIAFGLLQPVDGQSPDGWFTLGAIIAYFAPYALLPAALKLGGTALGKLTGAFNDKSKGVFDRARSWDKGRKERRATFKKQIKQEQRIRDLNAGGLGIKRNWARNRLRASQGATGLGMYVGPHATEKRRRAEAVVAGAADKGRKQAVEEEKAKLQTEPHYSNTGALLHIAQTAPPARARAASERLIELGADGELRKLRDGVRVDAAGNNTGGPNFDQSHESRKLFDTLQQSGATAPVREKANDLVRGQAAFDTVPTAPDMQKWSKGTYEAAFLHANGDAHLDKVVERFTTDADFAATIDDAKLEKINDALASRGRALIAMTDGAKKPFTPSDARLKKNITRTGNDVGAFGLPEYEYSYVWSDERYLGVMAQDVQQVCPEAVVEINGFLHVRYDMLGTELRKKGE